MEFHGIDTQGEIYIQRAASLSAWAADDEGRLLYAQDTASLYYGTNTQWMPLAGFGAGTRIWFHQNISPIGWSIVAGLGDKLLAVKGGSQAYNVAGGVTAGTWTQPSHTLSEAEIPSHYHLRPQRYLWLNMGSMSGGHYYSPYPTNTVPTSSTGGGQPHSHGGNTTRYSANVGIIATKD